MALGSHNNTSITMQLLYIVIALFQDLMEVEGIVTRVLLRCFGGLAHRPGALQGKRITSGEDICEVSAR